MDEMTDAALISYCDLHCETQRALFIGNDINRMLALAGHPDGFARRVPDDEWISVHEPMKELCALARKRMTANATVSQPREAASETPPPAGRSA